MSVLFFSLGAKAQTQKGQDIDGQASLDYAGQSVSMPDANIVAIGSDGAGNAGRVRVCKWNGSVWVQKGTGINGEGTNDRFGASVSMPDSNTVAIGAHANDGNGTWAGHVRVYIWNGSIWQQKGLDIDGEATEDRSGWTVSMPDPNNVAIGAWGNDDNGSNAGHVRVYTWTGSSWVQKGIDIDGEAAGDKSGRSVSMPDANTIAIGAIENDGSGTDAGHVRVYTWTGSSWVQKGIDIDGEAAGDESGGYVSMPDANTVAIGAENNAAGGHVRVYSWNGSSWVQKGTDIDGESVGDKSGVSVSMPDANTVAIGASHNDGNGQWSGHVRVYKWNGSIWLQEGTDINGEAPQDYSGSSVSMPDTNTVAIGAWANDGGGTTSGHARVYSLCNNIFSSISPTACDSYTSPSGNNVWTISGTYTDLVNNSTGCDSVITVFLTITNSDSVSLTVTECDSYTWNTNGQTYTQSGQYTEILSNQSGCDSTVTLNLTINNSTTGIDVITACDSYTWIDGNTYTSSNNIATFTLVNSGGCDSIVTLDLTINSVSDITTSLSGLTIIATNTNAAYQWLDCDNNYSVIAGETGQSFTASQNVNYAVELTENGCIDTTSCVAITTVGIIENSFGHDLLIYPNPTDGNFSIDLGDNHNSITVKITDLNGKLIQSKQYNNSHLLNLNIDEPAGIYVLLIESTNKKAIIQLVKE